MPEESLRYAAELRRLVEAHAARLDRLSSEVVRRRPAPGKWSIAEIVGHLVDSASSNHQRFVRARWQDALEFPGYAQDDWVAAQRYNETDWRALLELWRSFNLHLATLMEATPAAIRTRPYTRHNFDQIGFRPVAAGSPVTLDWLMEDYVVHLEHHLKQIDALLSS